MNVNAWESGIENRVQIRWDIFTFTVGTSPEVLLDMPLPRTQLEHTINASYVATGVGTNWVVAQWEFWRSGRVEVVIPNELLLNNLTREAFRPVGHTTASLSPDSILIITRSSSTHYPGPLSIRGDFDRLTFNVTSKSIAAGNVVRVAYCIKSHPRL